MSKINFNDEITLILNTITVFIENRIRQSLIEFDLFHVQEKKNSPRERQGK